MHDPLMVTLSFEKWCNASACVLGVTESEGMGHSGRTHLLISHVQGASMTQRKFYWSWWMHLSWGFLDSQRGLCQLAFTSICSLSSITGTADGCPMFRVVRLRSDLLPWGMVPYEQANQVSGLHFKWPTDIEWQSNQDVRVCTWWVSAV